MVGEMDGDADSVANLATFQTPLATPTKICKLQQKWEQNSSPITCEQNRIGEMEKEKSTRASNESCNIATYL